MSKLYFRYGAMNCGKTTNLLQVAFNYEERGMKVLILKPYSDTKGGNKIVSRLGVSMDVHFLIEDDKDLYESVENYIKKYGEIHCVLVDESQFLSSKKVDELFMIAVKMNIPVICYGLRTDFRVDGFPGSERLLLVAHSLEELKTICKCGKKAMMNGRKIGGKFVFEGEQIAIEDGVKVEYESLCPQCYYKFREKENIQ